MSHENPAYLAWLELLQLFTNSRIQLGRGRVELQGVLANPLEVEVRAPPLEDGRSPRRRRS